MTIMVKTATLGDNDNYVTLADNYIIISDSYITST